MHSNKRIRNKSRYRKKWLQIKTQGKGKVDKQNEKQT